MTDDIRTLIESLRRGQFDDPAEKIGLLAAALQEGDPPDIALVRTLLSAPQVPLRLAALEACRGRPNLDLMESVVRLARDVDVRVRTKLAEVLRVLPGAAVAAALRDLLEDGDGDVREGALKGCAVHGVHLDRVRTLLLQDPSWAVRRAAAKALADQPGVEGVADLYQALAKDLDEDVRRECAQAIERRLTEVAEETAAQLPSDAGALIRGERALQELGANCFPRLKGWLADRTAVAVSPELLASFGTDLTALAEAGTLPRAHGFEEPCRQLLAVLRQERVRPLVLLGESGTGKSALVNELVHRLAAAESGGWRVLRVSPADMMSGTRYVGEWETKVRQLVEAIRRPRRVVLYVPNLADLASMGQWSKSDYNVAAALAPHLEDGSLVLLGESTPSEFDRGLGAMPALRRLFGQVLLREADAVATRQILGAIRDEQALAMADSVLDQLQELSGHYLGHVARPGCAAMLLREVASARKPGDGPVTTRDVLNALSRSTGIPADLLDDAVPLETEKARRFFTSRILGQPEAVQAMVDLIQLVKAGLTDPRKPFGVFLFVGPTGVGKTELARTLAEFIFGDPARLLRLDMSEYASFEGFERLLGRPREAGRLTDPVRRQPFSVVLLDEIEKSHPNVFDLCLQLFDAGRLTDGQGRTVDFRRTIIILTSNVGSTAPTPVVGFNPDAAGPPPEAERARVQRELNRFFRPEFLNRLDRIVHFLPLTLEVAEQVARRELELVLQRSGVARRQLTVEVDAGVVARLVREGYSAHFGARPLKRTVERLVLLPLARMIAGGRIGAGALVRLTEVKGAIEAIRLEPGAVRTGGAPATPPAQDAGAEAASLAQRLATLQPAVQGLEGQKAALLERTRRPEFQRDAAERADVLDAIHKLDQFLARYQAVSRAVERAAQPVLPGRRDGGEVGRNERRLELASEVAQLEFVAGCQDPSQLTDAVVALSRVDQRGSPRGAVERLARVYLAFARRRRLTVEVLAEWWDERTDRVWLLIGGLGAFALLQRETGLHQFDHRQRMHRDRSGRETVHEDREIVRVAVLPAGTEPDRAFRARVKVNCRVLRPVRARLLPRMDHAVRVFDEQSVRSAEGWTAGPWVEAVERMLRLLHTLVRARQGDAAEEGASVIRHYDTGMGPRIRDLRSGCDTSRVEQVYKGRLELLW